MPKRSYWGEGTLVVLGIDASLTSTGLALVDYSTGNILATETVGSSTLRGGERLAHNLEGFQKFCNPSRRKIFITVLEDYAMHAESRGKLQMAEWVGVIKAELFHLRELDPLLIQQSTLKKFLTGNGQTPKDFVALEAFKRFGWDLPTTDEVDACGLATFGRCYNMAARGEDEWREGLIKKQIEAVLGVLKKNDQKFSKGEKDSPSESIHRPETDEVGGIRQAGRRKRRLRYVLP